jgi:hypothetical protein
VDYQSHFTHADQIIVHLGGLRGPELDPLLEIKYVGFVVVACVTVFEMAIKDILGSFAEKKHKVFGSYVRNRCERMNGKIQIDALKQDYISQFGDKYKARFDANLAKALKRNLLLSRRDIRASYRNLIVWRNDFAHQGIMSANATWAEAVQAYEDGKEVIRCIDLTLVR